nr:MAG TPA_asm: hypothetical protein [Caudoviricetes sp.]
MFETRRIILGVIFSPFCQLIRRKTVGLTWNHVGDTTYKNRRGEIR